MSGFQKKLAYIVPILTVASLILWWLGHEQQVAPKQTQTQPSSNVVIGERYAVKPARKLVLPTVNLQFLGEKENAKISAKKIEQTREHERVVFDEPTSEETTKFPSLSTNVFAPGSRSGKNRFRAPAIELIDPAEEHSETNQEDANQTEGAKDLQSVLVKPNTEAVEAGTIEMVATETEVIEVNATKSETVDGTFEPTPELPPLPAQLTVGNDSTRVEQATNTSAGTTSPIVAPEAIRLSHPSLSDGLPDAIKGQINQRLEYAGSLARRGAFSSAEEIYFQVIRLIAETKDSQFGGREHMMRLANALTAFSEAQDFITTDLQARVRMKVENVVASHNTPLLQEFDCSAMTSVQALQRYYEYAGEELVNAVGEEEIASEALYQLGKLYSTNSQYSRGDSTMQNAKAMIIHQTALAANPNNYLSGNELGVLLARYGQLEDAKDILVHSVSISPQSATWRNLAVVHNRLGEANLARLAKKEAEIASLEYKNRSKKHQMIQWVDHATFEKVGGKRDDLAQQAQHQSNTESKIKSSKPAASTARAKREWWRFKR